MYFHLANARIVLVRFHFEIKTRTVHVFDKCWMQGHRVTFNDTRTKNKMQFIHSSIHLFIHLVYETLLFQCKSYLTANVRFSAIFSNTFTNCNLNASRRRLRRIFSCFRSTASRMYITNSSIKSLFLISVINS